jgi:hypothetical protein
VRAGSLASWSALAAALLVAAGALLPVPPQFLQNQIDSSFAATLHFGAAHGYAVGSRLISTYGPLGFVFSSLYAPETFAWLLGLRAALAAVTCWALAWLGYAAWASPWAAAIAVLACVPFLALPDVWLLTLPLLALLIELGSERRAPLALRLSLGAAIGIASLIKFTFLLAASVALAPLIVSEALMRRRISLLAIAAFAAAALGWIASGQPLGAVLPYLDWSLRDISSAYPSAMQMPADTSLMLHAAGVSLAVLIGVALLARRRGRAAGSALIVATAGIVFLLWRAGFVRADAHVYITVFGLLVAAVLLALLWDGGQRHIAVSVLLIALFPGALYLHASALQGTPWGDFRPIRPDQAIGRLAALPLVVSGDALARAHRQRMADIRTANPLPELAGTVDAYPHDQAVALAYGLDVRPRPVFQSYMAYSPRLARANADYLLSENAPEWILFRISTINSRLPALDDATSWPRLMTRYRITAEAGAYAVLQRRTPPLPWHLEQLAHVDTMTGDTVAVPPTADGPIWARIDVQTTRRDAVVGALLVPPVVAIGVALSDGKQLTHRLVPALAREGFLLSPLVEDTADFIRLMSMDPDLFSRSSVAALAVQVLPAPGIADEPRPMRVEFFRLVVGQ